MHWYGIMYLLGFFAAWAGMRWRARQSGSPVSVSQVEDLIFYGALGVVIGGRLGYILFYSVFYDLGGLLDNPLSVFNLTEGGMSFHGGLIGVLIAMWLYARRQKMAWFSVTDTIAPWIPPGLFFGRIGNFINGELWGGPSDLPWAVVYNGEAVHPSQLYEALLEGIVLFAILLWFSSRPRPRMAVSGLFLACYGLFRIGVEFVRLPDDGTYLAWGWLTRGQLYSAPMLIAGVILLVLAYRGAGRDADQRADGKAAETA